MEDIGALFPSGDPALAGADSIELLREAWRRVRDAGWELENADVVLIGEEPRLAPHRNAMRARLADALGVAPELVAVRATTTDGLGFTGRREGLAAQAVALLRR
jgi:2-C-methyl-D-erythritol 2,4-cyclodiphosphate synthase